MSTTIRFTLDMPPEMLDWIDEERDEGTSREEFVRESIRQRTILKDVD